jgi:PadR family transcriptional regulator, regulatory protein PadR
MSQTNRELLKGSLEVILLTLLEHESMYGYQIVKEVQRRSSDALVLKEGSLYPALHRLEQAGWLESVWQARQDGVNRRYYRLTPEGRKALIVKRDAWMQFVITVKGVIQHAPTT